MKVKIFDESHEKDLETSINSFLHSNIDIVDILLLNFNIHFNMLC